MSWYIHPSKQLRDDELPPELVVTNRDGSIEQAYVPYNASDKLQAENAKLRELVRVFYHCTTSGDCDECPINGGGAVHLMPDTICDTMHDRMRELGVDDG